jgi:hypothetical protein
MRSRSLWITLHLVKDEMATPRLLNCKANLFSIHIFRYGGCILFLAGTHQPRASVIEYRLDIEPVRYLPNKCLRVPREISS